MHSCLPSRGKSHQYASYRLLQEPLQEPLTFASPCTVAFQLYDKDGDGFVSPEELLAVLRMIMGRGLSEKALEQVRLNL